MLDRFGRSDPAYVVGMVSGGHFVSHLYLLAYPPLFPLLAVAFDATTAELGVLVTAIYAPQLLLQFPLGELVDRVGAKRILVAGILVTSLSIGLSGLATAYWMLLACAFASGIGQSVFHPADYALLDAVTEPDTEGVAFSSHTFGGYVGFAVAPALIGGLGIAFSWQLALVAAGSIGIAYAAVLQATTAPVHSRRTREAETAGDDGSSVIETVAEMASFARRPALLSVFVFYLLSMVALVGLQSFTTVLAVDTFGFDESTANTLLTAHLASTAVGVLVGGPLADRVSFGRVVVGCFLASAVGVWLTVAGGSQTGFVGPLLALSAVGLAIGAALPSRDKFANAAADPTATGKSFGFFFTGLSLGAVVSPAVLGVIIDVWSPAVAFTLVGAVLVVAASVVAATARSPTISAAPSVHD